MRSSDDDDAPPPDDGCLSLSTRKEIFDHVQANPGIHFSQLKRDLDMATELLQHHLGELERFGLLESEKRKGRRRVFVTSELSDEERAILSVLRYETTRRILLYLLEVKLARTGEIADAVGVTPSTISWHLSNLIDERIVEKVRGDRTTYYRVGNPELTMQLLVRYRESFVDRAVDRLIDFWG